MGWSERGRVESVPWAEITSCEPAAMADREVTANINVMKTTETVFVIVTRDRQVRIRAEPGASFMGLWNVLKAMVPRS